MAVVRQPVVEPTLVLPSFNFSPTAGPLGTEVTLSGNALSTPVALVLFNGVPASRFQDPQNPSNLIAIVPAGATDGPITLTYANGNSVVSLANFDVLPGIATPKVRSFFPTSGAAGTLVQLDGSGFTQADTVLFGGVPATQFTVQADTNIIVVVPAGAQDGPITVRRGGVSGVSTGSFDVTGTTLSITGFSPAVGVSGAQVAIFGNGFLGVDTVLFGSLPALFTVLGDGLISATAPAGFPGSSVSITVRKGAAQASTGTLLFTFDQVAASPVITGFSPLAGPVGASVSIFGNNLLGVDVVRFAGVSASFAIVSPNQLVATVPAGAMDGFITVQDGGAVAQSSGMFDVMGGGSGFAVTGISPTSGQAGTPVTLTGSGFLGVTQVRFGNVSVQFSVQNDTSILAIAPAGTAGITVAVTVFKAGMQAGGFTFTYTAVTGIAITAITPNPASVGQVVRILGTGFSSVVQVRVGRMLPNFTVVSDSEIRLVASPGLNGLVTVIAPSGSAMSSVPLRVV